MLATRFGICVFLTSVIASVLAGCGGTDLAGIGDIGEQGDARLDSVLGTIRRNWQVPALGVIAIAANAPLIRDNAVAGIRAEGSASRVGYDDLWHMGSLTKPMTATLAARLVESQTVAWDVTVGQVFPDFVGVIRPEYEDVRLDELMYHTAGLPTDVTLTPSWSSLRTDPAPLPEQRRRWAVELLSLEPAGERGVHRYSDAGYIVAGAMMEELTGQSWEQLMQTRVFDPLGMTSAGFGPPGSIGAPPDQPRGHTRVSDGAPWLPLEPDANADNPAALGPAGTVHVSLEDYGKYVREHLRGLRGSSDFLSATSWGKLHTAAPGTGYALAWGVDQRTWAGGQAFAHSGSNAYWFAVAWIAPERDRAFVAVTNVGGVDGERATDQAVQALVLRAGFSF